MEALLRRHYVDQPVAEKKIKERGQIERALRISHPSWTFDAVLGFLAVWPSSKLNAYSTVLRDDANKP
jgi:hypothetical protein